MERDLTTLRYQAASTGTGTLAVTIEELNAVQRALDAEREKVKGLEALLVGFDGQDEVIEMEKSAYYALRDRLATLQAQLAEIEQILCIESGNTTVDKVRDLHQSFKQVWNSYQGAGNDLFDMQAQLRQVEGERDLLRGVLKEIAFDCEHVGAIQHLDKAERRTWVSVANRIKAALTPAAGNMMTVFILAALMILWEPWPGPSTPPPGGPAPYPSITN